MPTRSRARGGIAITHPKRGFINKFIIQITGVAPAGSKIELFDGPISLGFGESSPQGIFSIPVGPLGEGTHLLRADATGVGTSSVVTVTVDTTPPLVSFVEIPPLIVEEPYARFRWQASEEPLLFSHQLDDEKPSPFALADRIGKNALSPGMHTFTVVAKDLAGNQGPAASVTFSHQPPSHEKLTNLTIASNPFTPNGDGIDDTVTISAAMADGSAYDWKIEIKNEGGITIQSYAGRGTILSVTWDGKNGVGVPQAVATYGAEITIDGVTRSFKVHLSAWKTGYLHTHSIEAQLPAAGLSLEINRRYRSDRANEQGAFGKGHFSDVLDTKVTVDNRKLPVTFVTPAEQKMTFPFKREFAGATGHFQATWAAPEGHLFKDRLAPAYVVDLANNPQNPEYVDPDLNDYRPERFDWKKRDGDQKGFSLSQGIEYSKDLNGNEITYVPGAIRHSNGQRMEITRSPEGRITKIRDPKGSVTKYTYDDAGRLVSVTSPTGSIRQMSYDAHHRLTLEKTSTGMTLGEYAYDPAGNLVAARDDQLQTFGFAQRPNRDRILNRGGMPAEREFNPDGTIAKEISPLGEEVRYTYNDLKLPTRIDHASLGASETLLYDPKNGDILEKKDAYGTLLSFTYDPGGRILSSSSEGDHWRYSYDEKGNLLSKVHETSGGALEKYTYTYGERGAVTSETGPDGKKTTYAYDAAGNRTKVAHADGTTVELEYNANGRVVSEKHFSEGSSIRSMKYEYDAADRLNAIAAEGERRVELLRDELGHPTQVKITQADGSATVEKVSFSGRGDLLEWVDDHGTKIRHIPDANGQIVEEQMDGETVAYHEYDERGRRIRTVYPDGRMERRGYDALNRVIAIESSDSPREDYTYDAKGRVASKKVQGTMETYAYDSSNKLSRATVNNGSGTWIDEYDARGRTTRRIDATGMRTSYSYDAKGNLIKVTQADPNGGAPLETAYTVDERGNRLTQTDAKGRTTKWTYDEKGRVTSRTLPMGQMERFFYNTQGQLLRHEKFDGSAIGYTYTAEGKLYRKIYPDGDGVTWLYDPEGRLVEILDYRGSTRYVRDRGGKPEAVIDPKNHAIRYDYDPSGRVTRLALEKGGTRYGFDDRGRPIWIRDASGRTTAYTYDGISDRRVRIDHGNGTVESFEYDPAGRIARITHKDAAGEVLREFHYRRNPAGQITYVAEGPVPQRTVDYLYDWRGMLTKEKVTAPNGNVEETTYQYDEAGNRIAKWHQEIQTHYEYDANDRLVRETTEGQAILYEYDANGNAVARKGPLGNASYVYDFENCLREASMTTGSQVTTVACAYDPEGIRTAKTVWGAGGGSWDYIVDTNRTFSQVVAEVRGGQLWTLYAAASMGEKGNELVSTLVGLSRYDVHLDGSNRSVRMLTDSGQKIVEKYDYDAFGNDRSGSPSISTWNNPYRFAGEESDPHLGMSYNRARYYDPRTGRFHAQDTWLGRPDDPLSLHKYLYAENDPVNRTDPSGRMTLVELLHTQAVQRILAGLRVYAGIRGTLWLAHQAALVAHGYSLDTQIQWLEDTLFEVAHTWTNPDQYLPEWLLMGVHALDFAGFVVSLPQIVQIIRQVPRMIDALVRFGRRGLSLLNGLAEQGIRMALQIQRWYATRSIPGRYGIALSINIRGLDVDLFRKSRRFLDSLFPSQYQEMLELLMPKSAADWAANDEMLFDSIKILEGIEDAPHYVKRMCEILRIIHTKRHGVISIMFPQDLKGTPYEEAYYSLKNVGGLAPRNIFTAPLSKVPTILINVKNGDQKAAAILAHELMHTVFFALLSRGMRNPFYLYKNMFRMGNADNEVFAQFVSTHIQKLLGTLDPSMDISSELERLSAYYHPWVVKATVDNIKYFLGMGTLKDVQRFESTLNKVNYAVDELYKMVAAGEIFE